MIRTRFAPSPNGSLHLGHAWAAIVAHDLARTRGGEFLVRVEDIEHCDAGLTAERIPPAGEAVEQDATRAPRSISQPTAAERAAAAIQNANMGG